MPDLLGQVLAVGAFLLAVPAAAAQLLRIRADRRADRERQAKVPAERESIFVTTAEGLVAVVRQDYDRLHAENQALHNEVAELRQEVAAKARRVAALEARLRHAEEELRAVADELALLKKEP